MKQSKKFQRLRSFLEGGEGTQRIPYTSAAQPIDKPLLKVKSELQMSEQSTSLDDLDEEDWPSKDSFKVDSEVSDQTIGSSQATKSERRTIVSNSSSRSSRRSSIDRALLEKLRKLRKLKQKLGS